MLRARWTSPPWPASNQVASQADGLVVRIDHFVSAIENQLARWAALLNALQFETMALAIGSAVALLYADYLFVFNPLSRLQADLLRAGEGERGIRNPWPFSTPGVSVTREIKRPGVQASKRALLKLAGRSASAQTGTALPNGSTS